MRKIVPLFLSCLALVGQVGAPASKSAKQAAPQKEALPSHMWSASGPLTARSADSPSAIGLRYINSLAPDYGLSESDLQSLYLVKEYRTASNGVTHLHFRQQFEGIDVHGSDFTVNVDSDGQVLNAGGRLYGRPVAAAPSIDKVSAGARTAMQEINPSGDSSYLPVPAAKGEKRMKLVRGGFGESIEAQPVWYPAGSDLRPGWAYFLPDASGEMYYRAIVDAEKQRLLQTTRLGAYQNPQPPRGLVFLDTPQPNPKPDTLTGIRPYVQRTLVSLAGDPQASPRGWITGTETAGNNTITGENPVSGKLATPETAKSTTLDFQFPLQLGPGAPTPTAYGEAATTNLFYWMNRIHDYFWHIGFDEAAGNFQQDNYGRGGIGFDPIYAYSHYGVSRPGSALIDNASFTFYGSTDDGYPGYVRMYLAGDHDDNIFSDGSYDSAVIAHEYTHGVSGRLGRNVYETAQGGAMGEAWSDYFAMDLLLPEGLRPDGSYVFGEYAFQSFGVGSRSRPYSTDMTVNNLTLADYGRVADIGPEPHFDGEIWVEALWEARTNLVKLLGEKEGRRRMAMNVIEGLKMQPPRASMIDARDAIILANRASFKGEGEQQLWEGFAKRGLGVLAQSKDGNSTYLVPSFDVPSSTGLLKFHSPVYVPGEMVRLALYDSNNTSPTALVQVRTSNGDLENLTLRRRGTIFEGSMTTGNDGYVAHRDEYIDTIPSDFVTAYYYDNNTGSGQPKLIETTVTTQPEYTFTPQPARTAVTPGRETALFTVPTGGRYFLTYNKFTLPFSFKFFDKTYRSIYVDANGVITFNGPNPTVCNDADSAMSVPAIAPMWVEMVYGGTAQPNENVYVSQPVPDAVMVRWAAESPDTGEPINTSATLYSDGRIRYQYGDGNDNLVNTTANGCQSNTPFVGISAGRDSYLLRYANYDASPYLGLAPAVLIEPPFNNPSDPVVRIESPEQNGTVSGVLTVRGIAYDPVVRIARMDLLIDGVSHGILPINQARPDICEAEALNGCPAIGFIRSVDLSAFGLTAGTHRLQIRATNSRGSFALFPEQPLTFTYDGGIGRRPVVAVETPVEGATLSATTPIRGYAYASDLRLTGVDVLIDGVNYGAASYGMRRDDICNALPNRPPNCPGVGFQLNLNTLAGAVQLPNGKHALQVRVTDESGRFTLFPETPINVTVENAVNLSAMGKITFPAPNAKVSGVIKITGWAYDPDGTIASGDFVIYPRILGTLRVNQPAPEACADLTNVPACPNIGFEGDLDTTRFPNGNFLLYIRIRDNQNRTLILPDPTYIGMPITIQN